jgi:type III secretion protein W
VVDEVSHVHGTVPVKAIGTSPLKDSSRLAQELELIQEASEEAFEDYAEQLSNPFQRFNVQQNLGERVRRTKDKEKTEGEDTALPEAVEAVSSVEDAAVRFRKKNEELNDRVLVLLWQRVQGAETSDEVLEIVQEFYPDPSLADDALDFLIAIEPDVGRKAMIQEAKNKLHQRFEKEIRAGKNIASIAKAFAAKGLETPSSLRALYRYLLDNPKDPTELFEDLASKYSYDQLKDVIRFLVHSVNADLKSLAPSLEPAELRLYMGLCRVLSAILGVYFYFAKSQRAVLKQFQRYGISFPKEVTFESLSRLFCRLVDDRYPNAMKVVQLAPSLHVQGNFIAQLIFFDLFARAVNEVAPRLFRSDATKENLRKALLEATEQLENQIDTADKKRLQTILVTEAKARAASSRAAKKSPVPKPPREPQPPSSTQPAQPPSLEAGG